MRLKSLLGQRHGRLVVLEQAANVMTGSIQRVAWRCECDCGAVVIVRSADLIRSHTLSCGCVKALTNSVLPRTHGHTVGRTAPREYVAWQHAKRRCFNPRTKQWKDYGGRGITMDVRWVNDYAAFLDDMGPCPEGRTLDRIDNDGPYAPGNCRWATWQQQNNNKRPAAKRAVRT